MFEMLTINGVRGYLDKQGTAHLHVEDVARGLGFIETKDGKEYVMWRRLDLYLGHLNFGKSAENEFIPENIFYRLAMKASSQAAEKFQALVADEILPSIRKHGAYMTPQALEAALLNPDTMIKLLTNLKDEQERRKQAEQIIEEQRPKVLFADAVSASKDCILIGELAKILRQNGVETGQNRLFKWLRQNGYMLYSGGENIPSQRAMELGLFEITKVNVQPPDSAPKIRTTVKVTPKGQAYFIRKLLKGVHTA